MFRDKYRADNQKIEPDEALLRYLSVRMTEAGDTAGNNIPDAPSGPAHRRHRWLRPAVALAACFAIAISAGGLYVYFDTKDPQLPPTDAKVAQVKTGVTYSEVYALVKSMEPKAGIGDVIDGFFGFRSGSKNSNGTQQAVAEDAAAGAQAPTTETTESKDYSKTNTQVADVDEADIVKTDGQYIYTLTNNNKLVIVRAQGTQMQTVANIDCTTYRDTDYTSYPIEMYVNGDRLVILKGVYMKDGSGAEATAKGYAVDMMWYGSSMTSAAVYDISDRANPKLLADPGQSGNYLSSRMIGNTLYLITNHSIYTAAKKNDPSTYIPMLYNGGKKEPMAAQDITISAQPQGRQYAVVTALDVKKPDERLSSKTVLGCGTTLYASTGNLLIASSGTTEVKEVTQDGKTTSQTAGSKTNGQTATAQSGAGGGANAVPPAAAVSDAVAPDYAPGAPADEPNKQAPDYAADTPAAIDEAQKKASAASAQTTVNDGKTTSVTYIYTTNLIRFSLNSGKIELAATGTVPGTLLNQFSMDEYKGVYRLVTTANTYTETRNGSGDTGTVSWGQSGTTSNALYTLNSKLEILGRIENVAKGERVYSVRFDGVIGYFVTFRQVDPLFAVDLNDPANPKILSALKIPGFSEYLHPYAEGLLFGLGRDADVNSGRAGGLKLSMFDVSNPANVTEKQKLILEQYWSDASYNHKAIVVSPERGLIAFPADNKYMVFSYSKAGGFAKVAEILQQDGNYYNQRGLYIGDVFYVCNNVSISAYSMNGYTRLATLQF